MNPKIIAWAKLIGRFEGAPSSLNNPGNFKYSPLIASWGGVQGPKGSDGGYFAKFPTQQKGFDALCNFLVLGCRDELKAYHHARTFNEFTQVYTNYPKPQYDYAPTIAKLLGIPLDYPIANFLKDTVKDTIPPSSPIPDVLIPPISDNQTNLQSQLSFIDSLLKKIKDILARLH